MTALDIDKRKLERLLSAVLGESVRLSSAEPLGESSRQTPWRVDVEVGGVRTSILLRMGEGCSSNEVTALRAMQNHPIPTPRLLHWDPDGVVLGAPVFVSEFIEGEPLLDALTAGEPWAEEMYIDTVYGLQSIKPGDLPDGAAAQLETGNSALDVLEDAYKDFAEPDGLIRRAYSRLKETQPELPTVRFSNGDLWPENLLVRDRALVGVIDWQHAGFSDPIYEFLLPFFLVPELRGRGIEERYCERTGFDPRMLHWYHGLEFFDSLRWVLKTGEPYMIHTADSLRGDLTRWLA